MELNTTGIDKFLVYLHAKDHFVPYESGSRLAMHARYEYQNPPKKQQCFALQAWWLATSAQIKAGVDLTHIPKV